MKTWYRNITFTRKVITHITMALLVVALLSFALPTDGFAGGPPAPPPKCTDEAGFNVVPGAGPGLVSAIINHIKSILDPIARQMFEGVASDGTFQTAVKGSVLLYIAIYGLLFTVGVVQATVSDIAIRSVKLSIIAILVSPGAWGWFNTSVITFFNTGTDDLISALTAIAVGGVAAPGGPFVVLDGALTKMLSAQMIVTVLAVFTTGPNGIIIGLMLLACLGSFIRTIFKAMLIYIMSLVLKTLLFGLAPIFISCILFSRTKHLFDGWLNQILNASLQPVMLFAFFAFFATLISSTIDMVLTTPVCWTQLAEGLRGSRFGQDFWRFKADTGGGMDTFRGLWHFTGAIKDGMPPGIVFPIDIVVVIIFLLLADLSARFNDIVLDVAKDISGAATNLSALGGSMNQWFGKTAGSADLAPKNAAPRKTPGNLGGLMGGGSEGRKFVDQVANSVGKRKPVK